MAELQYKTFSQLMSSIEGDLTQYVDNSLIKRNRYIKAARYVNSSLGIKINGKKTAIIDVNNFKGDLPTDCLSIITAIGLNINLKMNYIDEDIFVNMENVKIKNGIKNQIYHILKPNQTSNKRFCDKSINKNWRHSDYGIDVSEEIITTNFKEGQVYLEYIPHLENEEGDLLVLDHDKVNPYYEWEIKSKIFLDLWHNSDADTYNKYQDAIQIHLPKARQEAEQIVTTPEYKAMKAYNLNQTYQFYKRWIQIFE